MKRYVPELVILLVSAGLTWAVVYYAASLATDWTPRLLLGAVVYVALWLAWRNNRSTIGRTLGG